MPLLQPVLEQALFVTMQAYPPSIPMAAQGLAAAYATYAVTGTFLTGTIATLEPQEVALAAALGSAMVSLDAVAYASAWSAGLAAFWAGVPVVGANTGATIGCPGAAVAQTAILAGLNAMPAYTLEAAKLLATALHTATMTVTATVSLPAPPFTTVAPIL